MTIDQHRPAAAPITTVPTVPSVPAPRDGRHTMAPTPVDPPGTSTTPGVSAGAARATGVALAVFGAGWAGTMLVLTDGGADSLLGAGSAVAFQGSLLALLVLMWRTVATGPRTAARILLGVQMGVLALATVQSISEAVPGADVVATVLDPFWPLSMLGMLIVGVTVAVAARWHGAARVWTPIACSWIALLPTMAILPMSAVGYVMTGHVLVGYVVLGVILAARPDLVRR